MATFRRDTQHVESSLDAPITTANAEVVVHILKIKDVNPDFTKKDVLVYNDDFQVLWLDELWQPWTQVVEVSLH